MGNEIYAATVDGQVHVVELAPLDGGTAVSRTLSRMLDRAIDWLRAARIVEVRELVLDNLAIQEHGTGASDAYLVIESGVVKNAER